MHESCPSGSPVRACTGCVRGRVKFCLIIEHSSSHQSGSTPRKLRQFGVMGGGILNHSTTHQFGSTPLGEVGGVGGAAAVAAAAGETSSGGGGVGVYDDPKPVVVVVVDASST